jgi:hypothetical protein
MLMLAWTKMLVEFTAAFNLDEVKNYFHRNIVTQKLRTVVVSSPST